MKWIHVRRSSVALTIALMLLAGGCGMAAPARFASTYPAEFRATFAQSCGQEHASRAMCTCAVAKVQQAVRYPELVREAGDILSANFNVSPPGWWQRMQVSCRRHGAGKPPYVAPLVVRWLLPASSRVGTDVSRIADACLTASFGTPGPLPAGAQSAVADLLTLAHAYPADSMLIPAVGKIDSLRRALGAAVAFLRDQSCSPADADLLAVAP